MFISRSTISNAGLNSLPHSVSLSKRCITTPREEETRLRTQLADGTSVLGKRRHLPKEAMTKRKWTKTEIRAMKSLAGKKRDNFGEPRAQSFKKRLGLGSH
jgi:hypothetical protein